MMDAVKEKITKAADMAADTANRIKEVAANMLDKSSSNMEEFRDIVGSAVPVHPWAPAATGSPPSPSFSTTS